MWSIKLDGNLFLFPSGYFMLDGLNGVWFNIFPSRKPV